MTSSTSHTEFEREPGHSDFFPRGRGKTCRCWPRDIWRCLARRGLAALPDPRGLTAQLPEVVQLCPADLAARDRLDLVDRRAVHRERALDAHPVADLAHGKRLTDPAALTPDHHTLEHLDPGAVALLDAHV